MTSFAHVTSCNAHGSFVGILPLTSISFSVVDDNPDDAFAKRGQGEGDEL
jgi:hypothetical protein